MAQNRAIQELAEKSIHPVGILNPVKYGKYISRVLDPVILIKSPGPVHHNERGKSVCGIDNYKQLGVGAFGVVYEVEYKGQRCAMKILHRNSEANVYDFVEYTEISIPRQLTSRYTTPCIGFITPSECPSLKAYGILQPLATMDLHSFLYNPLEYEPEGRSLHFDDLATIAGDCVHGIFDMTKHNIVHLDIKPMNFLVFKDKDRLRAKVSDFGTAKFLEKGATINGHGRRYTMVYECPEAFIRTEYSFKSDVYSLGIVLLMIFLQPFEREGASQEGRKIDSRYIDAVFDVTGRFDYRNSSEGSRRDFYINSTRKALDKVLDDLKSFWRAQSMRKMALQVITEVIEPCLAFNPAERIDIVEVMKRLFVMTKRLPDPSDFLYGELPRDLDERFVTLTKKKLKHLPLTRFANANTQFLTNENLIRYSGIVAAAKKMTDDNFSTYAVVCIALASGMSILRALLPVNEGPKEAQRILQASIQQYDEVAGLIIRAMDGCLYYKSMLVLADDAKEVLENYACTRNFYIYRSLKTIGDDPKPKPSTLLDLYNLTVGLPI